MPWHEKARRLNHLFLLDREALQGVRKSHTISKPSYTCCIHKENSQDHCYLSNWFPIKKKYFKMLRFKWNVSYQCVADPTGISLRIFMNIDFVKFEREVVQIPGSYAKRFWIQGNSTLTMHKQDQSPEPLEFNLSYRFSACWRCTAQSACASFQQFKAR